MNKFLVLSVAIAACLSIDWIEAQKTAANSFASQQQQQWSSGSGQNSVYGGYGTSPVNQQQQRPRPPISQQSSSKFSAQSIRQQSYQQPRPVVQRPQPVQQQQQQQEEQSSYSSTYEQSQQQAEADAEPASYGSVSGQAGRDFPAYTQVPKTSFSCDGLPYEYGMYADEETGCQAYHLCYNGRKDSFLCGPGTVFNQRILHCDYWYSVDCAKSSQYYSSNAYMGSSQPEPGPAQANSAPAVQQQQSVSSSSSYRQTASSYNRPVSVGRAQAAQSFSKNTQQQQVQDGY